MGQSERCSCLIVMWANGLAVANSQLGQKDILLVRSYRSYLHIFGFAILQRQCRKNFAVCL